MYEPSKELIEQIAEEYWDLELGASEGDYETSSDEDKKYFRGIVKEFIKLPTSSKAFEQMENRPKWQDKPDKEGWWCAMAKERQCGWYWLYTPVNPVYVYKQKGALYLRKYDVEDFILKDYTLSEYLKRYKDYDGIKFLYLPEPEPYKGEE